MDKFPHTVTVHENHVPIYSTEEEGSIEDGVEVKTKLQQQRRRLVVVKLNMQLKLGGPL